MKSRLATAVLVAVVLAVSPQAAYAASDTVDPAVDAAPVVTSFSLMGTGIVLTVEMDPAGHLTSVELLDDAGAAPADAVATSVSPHRVKFVLDDSGTRVEVKAEGKKVESKVKASSLADLLGEQRWSGELFGAGNGVTDLVFTVSDDGGVPVIELVSLTGPGTFTSQTSVETDDDEAEAKLRIELVDDDGNEARITVEVEVEVEDDDDDHGGQEAKLKISVRSDLFATGDVEGPVDDPEVNTPVRDDEDHDDDDDDEEEDHDEDEDDDDDEDDDGGHDDDDDDDEEEDDD